MKNYFPLIEIKLMHKYYAEGKCRDIELLVSSECSKVLNNFKLQFKKIDTWHYILFAECDEFYEERLKILANEIKEDQTFLTFVLLIANSRFVTVTPNISNTSDKKLVVFPIEVGSDENMVIDFKNVEQTKPQNNFEKAHIKKYPKLLSLVNLNLSNSNNDVFINRIKNKNTISVSIAFDVKQAYWKYIFIPRNDGATDLVVNEIKQQIRFSEIEWQTLDNNQKAGITYSLDEVVLSEKYPYLIQLWKNFNNGKSLVLSQLSLPNPENVANFLTDENNTNYISIYQYY